MSEGSAAPSGAWTAARPAVSPAASVPGLVSLRASRLRQVRLAVAAGCHVAAVLQYVLDPVPASVAGDWLWQFLVLMGLSLLAAAASVLVRQTWPFLVTILLRLLVLLPSGYPLGGFAGVEHTLLLAVIFDLGICLSLPYGALLGASATLVVMLSQGDGNAWGQPLAGVAARQMVWMAATSVFAIVATTVIRYYGERSTRQEADIQRMEGVLAQLMTANLGFQRLAASVEQQSKEEERKRVTREIHDTVGYTLTNLMMMAEEAIDLCPESAVRTRSLLRNARQQAQEGLNETRRALRLLRRHDKAEPFSLQTIHKLVTTFSSVTAVEVRLETGNAPWQLAGPMGPALYRFVQEGLTNAFTHGKATHIRIALWVRDGLLTAAIHDNGSGTPGMIKEGIGLAGMRERIGVLGGSVAAHSLPDGFELTAVLPVTAASQGRTF